MRNTVYTVYTAVLFIGSVTYLPFRVLDQVVERLPVGVLGVLLTLL